MFQKRLDQKNFDFVQLRPGKTVKNFDCGDKDLNDFILNKAADYQKHRLAVSYACVDVNDASKVYAYCSLANDKVAVSDFKDKTDFNRFRREQGFPNSKRLRTYPAVKLCRLGVDSVVKKQHVGTTVLNYIKSMFSMENKAACRFLTVDAYLDAIPFYEKNKFKFMNAEDEDPHTRLMYYDLKDLDN